jgi:hypothetical protein
VRGGRGLLAGHANDNGMTLITGPRRGWSWCQRDQRHEQGEHRARPGSRLIGTGGVLLFLLGSGLLAVSFAAQYQYVLRERHQHVASLIEAGALDVGLIIFSLLALGLARAGLSAKIERAAVVGCAVGSVELLRPRLPSCRRRHLPGGETAPRLPHRPVAGALLA